MTDAMAKATALLGGLRGDNEPVVARAIVMGFNVRISRGLAEVQVPGVSRNPETRKLTIPLPAGGMAVWAATAAKVLHSHRF